MKLAIISTLLAFLTAIPVSNCPCETGEIIEEIDFIDVPQSWFLGPNAKWETTGDFDLKFTQTGLVIDASPYTQWSASPAAYFEDHVKGLLELQHNFTESKLYIEAELTGKTFGTENNPFPDDMTVENDFRLANCGIAVTQKFRFEIGGLFQIGFRRSMLLLTNDRIYAAVENVLDSRWFTSPPSNNVLGSLFVAPIARRNPDQWHRLGFLINRISLPEFQVTIDGSKPFYPFTNLGAIASLAIYNGILYQNVVPEFDLFVSFGHFTFLDAYSPCKDPTQNCSPAFDVCERSPVTFGLVRTGISALNYDPFTILGPRLPAQYWDSVGTLEGNHIWGQGSELKVRKLTVRSFKSCEI